MARAVKQVMADGRLRWRCWACWTDASGQYRRERVYGKTKQEAEEAAASVRAKGRGAIAVDPKQTTVEEFLTAWLDGLSGISASTRLRYTQQLTHHLIPAFGQIKLTKLTPLQVRQFVRQQELAGLAPATIDAHLTRLRSALAVAVNDGLLARNPAAAIKAPRGEQADPVIWSRDQAAQFLAANIRHQLYPLWLLALGTGCRIGELAALRWGDVDLAGAQLVIQRTATRNAQAREIVGTTTKGRRTRTLPLPASCVAALKHHRAMEPGTATVYVFRNAEGRRWKTDKLRRRFAEACRRARVPEVHPHSLRHLTATWLAEQGAPMHIIQAILGHAGIAMSLRYGRVTTQMQKSAAAALDGYLQPGANESHQFLTDATTDSKNAR